MESLVDDESVDGERVQTPADLCGALENDDVEPTHDKDLGASQAGKARPDHDGWLTANTH